MEMRRFGELLRLASERHPNDAYLATFLDDSNDWHGKGRRRFGWAYERALATLDIDSWGVLRDKALEHFTDHREGQTKQGFYNQLNDAFAYAFLRRRGHTGVKVLRENRKTKTPDIEYVAGGRRRFCEVKSVNISNAEIKRRGSGGVFDSGALYGQLSPGVIKKFGDALNTATTQIKAVGDGGLIFVVITFDDYTLDFWSTYRRQLVAALAAHPAPNVYVKIGQLERKFVVKGTIGGRRRAA
jgi:hypothetical protein